MRVEWLRTAAKNLDDEARHIAADSPQAAALVVARISKAVELLAEQPHIARPGRVPGTRELIVLDTPHILPYRVKDNTVQILRIFHTSRQLPASW